MGLPAVEHSRLAQLQRRVAERQHADRDAIRSGDDFISLHDASVSSAALSSFVHPQREPVDATIPAEVDTLAAPNHRILSCAFRGHAAVHWSSRGPPLLLQSMLRSTKS